MEDICNRLDSKSVNKKILESLIRAGALDWTLEPRCVLFERVDLALSGASQVHKDKALGQGSLFDMTFEAPRVKDEPAVRSGPRSSVWEMKRICWALIFAAIPWTPCAVSLMRKNIPA